MKRYILSALFILSFLTSWAKHEKGGWILYEYISSDAVAKTSTYKITVTVFFLCDPGDPRGPRDIIIGVYNGGTNNAVLGPLTGVIANSKRNISKSTLDPCISNPPSNICYEENVYTKTVVLPDDVNGYTIVVNTAGKRTTGLINVNGSGNTSLSITAQIPGNTSNHHINTSPKFLFKDTAIICYSTKFDYQFSAIDSVDKDSLSYSFGSAYDGLVRSTPPLGFVTYNAGFSGSQPLGSGVTIDAATGLISGVAPTTTGEYVIDVYVKEWRNGVLIDSIKKELQIIVNNCTLLGASLDKLYVNCDSLSLTFLNGTIATTITSYEWNFGDPISPTNITTTPVGSHTFSQPGTYLLTLTVRNSGGCSDKATATVKVYPGFKPNFNVVGNCYQSNFTFTDATVANYGVVNSWKWNFGDPTLLNNTASTPTAIHLYTKPDTVIATLNVGSSVGCTGTFSKKVIINDKPSVSIPYTSIRLCSNDSLQLSAITSAPTYSWLPNYNILNANTLLPTVFPKDTTVYTFTAKENGCIGTASIKVEVLKYISVAFKPDTLFMCKTDTLVLQPITDAYTFLWTESNVGNSLNSTSIKNPKASPLNTYTKYHLDANLGRCQANANLNVFASPYPQVKITYPKPDTTICYGKDAYLKANIKAAYFNWMPIATLKNENTLSPIAHPESTTKYYLTVRDTLYCKKLVTDSTIVKVVPKVNVFAGNDTNAVIYQPLQFNASIVDTSFHYPLSYSWKPSNYLSNSLISNPILTVAPPSFGQLQYIVIAKTAQGCSGTDTLKVKVFNSKPDIFIPSAFSPNNDGINDVLTPILVGISKLDYFTVYNRFGKIVFTTNKANNGWTGYFNGIEQTIGTYVYMAQGIDYLGNTIFKKGTVVLIK